MNHSCDPNCDTDIIDDKIWIRSFKDIEKGEELTYDYGFTFDEDDLEITFVNVVQKNALVLL